MIRTISQTESARRDTLISRAADVALDRISSRLFGLSRPANYPRDAWRRMLVALAYQPRGTLRTLFGVLDALFSPWSALVKLDGLTVAEDGTFNSADIETAHVGRFAWWYDEQGGERRLVFVEYADEGVSGRISTVTSGYASAWSGTGTGRLEFLPFVLAESDCKVTLWLDAELLSAPPTYLQSPDGSERPVDQPFGGHLLNLFDLDPETLDYGDQERGPFPLYLTGDEVGGLIGHVMRCLLVAGVQIEARLVDFGAALGYGPLYALPRYGRVGPASLGG